MPWLVTTSTSATNPLFALGDPQSLQRRGASLCSLVTAAARPSVKVLPTSVLHTAVVLFSALGLISGGFPMGKSAKGSPSAASKQASASTPSVASATAPATLPPKRKVVLRGSGIVTSRGDITLADGTVLKEWQRVPKTSLVVSRRLMSLIDGCCWCLVLISPMQNSCDRNGAKRKSVPNHNFTAAAQEVTNAVLRKRTITPIASTRMVILFTIRAATGIRKVVAPLMIRSSIDTLVLFLIQKRRS